MNINIHRRLVGSALLAAALTVLAGCSGGGGGGGSDTSEPVGSAAILITDATQDGLDDVSVTIDSITLTGTDTNGDPITHTLDHLDIDLNLKHLITTSYLADVVQGIPAGEYDSIAIHVVRVVVDDYDDDRPAVTIQVDETVTLSLEDSPIVVSNGTITTIALDFDLSLSLGEDNGEWTWQSRFFVQHGDDVDHEVDDLHGIIAPPADLVCEPPPASLTLTLTTLRTDREITLVVNSDTAIESAAADDDEDLDLAGLCALLDDLGVGETLRVEVTGAFVDSQLVASKLEIEDPNDIHVKGTITGLTQPDGTPVVVTSSVTRLDCSDTYGSMTVRDIFGDDYLFNFVDGHPVVFKNADECTDLETAMTEQATVKVSGTRQDGGSITLDRVKLEDEDEHMAFEQHRNRHMAVHGTAEPVADGEGLFLMHGMDGDVLVKVDDQDKVILTGETNRHHMGGPMNIGDGSCLQLSGELNDDDVLEAQNVVILPNVACR